ncbi:MAG: hypothetical protein ABIR47_17075 [Candidatus Kapaibacterium sp.]
MIGMLTEHILHVTHLAAPAGVRRAVGERRDVIEPPVGGRGPQLVAVGAGPRSMPWISAIRMSSAEPPARARRWARIMLINGAMPVTDAIIRWRDGTSRRSRKPPAGRSCSRRLSPGFSPQRRGASAPCGTSSSSGSCGAETIE